MHDTKVFSNPELFAQHLNNSPFGVIEWDANMKILFWSKQAEAIFGWSGEEVTGKHFTELPIVMEEDIELLRKMAGEFVKGQTERYTGQYKNKKKDGLIINCMWYSSVLQNEQGNVISILSMVQDISENLRQQEELKRISERFELITNATNDGIWEWDLVNDTVWVNETYCKTFGYNPADYPDYYDQWLKRIHPDDKEPFLENIYSAQQRKESIWSGEFRFLLANHEYGHIFQRAYFIYDEQGNPSKVVGIDLNMTEQRNTETALRFSEEKFSKAFMHTPVPLAILKLYDGIFIDANEAYCVLTGYSKNELLNKPYSSFQLVSPEEIFKLREMRIAQGFIKEHQLTLRTKYGEHVYCEVSAQTIKIEGEECILVLHRDITKELQALKTLRENETQLQLIYDSVADVICLFDVKDESEFRFVLVNRAFCTTTGFKAENVINRKLEEVMPEPTVSSTLFHFNKAIREGTVQQWEEITPFPTGVKTGIVSIAPVYNSEGKCYRIVASVHETTQEHMARERIKANEQQLQLIYDSVEDIIFLLDVEGEDHYKFITVNKAFEKATGIPASKVIGRYVKEIIPEPSLSLVLQKYRQAISRRVTVQWEEITPYPTGVKTGIVNITPVFNELGKCHRLVGSVNDITQQKKTQEDLNKSYEQIRSLASHLQKIREEERTLVALEIHDQLGQTLTGLKMELSWIKKMEKFTKEQIDERVQQAFLLLDDSINTVRTLASELRPSILDDLGLVEAIRWQTQEFQRRAAMPTVFTTNAEEIKLRKETATAFYRILQEALTNVARHAKASKVEIHLTKKKGGKLFLSVKDNGRGFSLENPHNTPTLGLLGMKERMFAIGGNFKIKSAPGQGTLVEIEAIV